MTSPLPDLRSLGLAIREAILGLTAVLLYAVAAPVGYCFNGAIAFGLAALAAAVCWVGAALAMAVSEMFRGFREAMYGMLMSTALRMGIPLGAAVMVRIHGGMLLEAGFLYYLVVFFLPTLAVETALSLAGGRAVVTASQVSRDSS